VKNKDRQGDHRGFGDPDNGQYRKDAKNNDRKENRKNVLYS
jgi:hypothetical protein